MHGSRSKSPLWPSFLGPSPPEELRERFLLIPPSALWTGEVPSLRGGGGRRTQQRPEYTRTAYQSRPIRVSPKSEITDSSGSCGAAAIGVATYDLPGPIPRN